MLFLLAASALAQPLAIPRSGGSPVVDGTLDEPSWASALHIDALRVPWEDRASRTATRARLLWTTDALYIGAYLEDADLYASLTEHDAKTWLNDVFEVFLKPPEGLGYYEFHVTPANTVLDLYLPSRGSGGWNRWADAQEFHLQSAVTRIGTLTPGDTDTSWTLELRIPWSDITPDGLPPATDAVWRLALCRYDYSVTLEHPELSTSAPLTRRDFHRYEEWPEVRFAR